MKKPTNDQPSIFSKSEQKPSKKKSKNRVKKKPMVRRGGADKKKLEAGPSRVHMTIYVASTNFFPNTVDFQKFTRVGE